MKCYHDHYPTCDFRNTTNYNFSNITKWQLYPAMSLFYLDGCMCVLFASLIHLKYSRIKVLSHPVVTTTTSNLPWTWFFLFTAMSSIMNGLNLNIKHKNFLIITGWFAHLLSILVLAFAIKYQWKYKEEAYNKISSNDVSETTPIFYCQDQFKIIQPSKTDVLFVVLFTLSGGFFIVSLCDNKSAMYWTAFGLLYLFEVVVFLMTLRIHYKTTITGPSVMTKCLFLAGVLLTMLSNIHSFVWITCILKCRIVITWYKLYVVDVVTGVILLSHAAFFFAVRSEFIRLKDITVWLVADRINDLEHQTARSLRQ